MTLRLASHHRALGDLARFLPFTTMRKTTQNPRSDSGDVNLSLEMLFALRDLRTLLVAIAWVEAKAYASLDYIMPCGLLKRFGYVLEEEPEVLKCINDLDKPTASRIANALDTDREPAWNLVGWVDILFGLFQSVDGRESARRYGHEYYEQREWRIGQLFGPHVSCSRLNADVSGLDGNAALSARERECLRADLRALDPLFFTEERLDGSAVLRGTADKNGRTDTPFFRLVAEVICPGEAEREVAALVKQFGLEARESM